MLKEPEAEKTLQRGARRSVDEDANLYYSALRRAEVPDLRLVSQQDFEFTPGRHHRRIPDQGSYDYIVLLETTATQYPDTLESRHLLHVAMTNCSSVMALVFRPAIPAPA